MKITDVDRWKVEVQTAENYREDEFGQYSRERILGAGENIQYFDVGWVDKHHSVGVGDRPSPVSEIWFTTLNIVDSITSIMVPSLFFQNPKTVTIPKKVSSEDTAPVVAQILDHYRKILDMERINNQIIWDAYVIGMGIDKIGYTTKIGMDVEDGVSKEKKKKKSLANRIAVATGLKKPEAPEEPERKEANYRIIAESPFVEHVSPFNFGMDFRTASFDNTLYRYQKVVKTIESMKANKKYKNTASLRGMPPEDLFSITDLSSTSIEAFETVEVYEIHYRNEGKWYLLVLSKDKDGRFAEHYHSESIYKLNDWQMDILTLKKHEHSLYPISDISKIKQLQDRITITIDNILEQVDKYVPKLAYDSGNVTEQGIEALVNGGIGALVECNKSPREAIQELNFTQLKADLQALIDQLISLISIQTGLSRTQLTGASQSSTATEATLEQGGQNIRIDGYRKRVQRFLNKQSERLWKVIKQFVDLTELQLINGVKGQDPETGLPIYDWLTIDDNMAEKLYTGEYDFDIEVGSTQKTDLGVMRKAFENMFNILARTDVLIAMQQQGDIVRLGEMLKKYWGLFPELGIDSGKVIQQTQQGSQGPVTPPQTAGGPNGASANNSIQAQMAQPVPSGPQNLSQGAQV